MKSTLMSLLWKPLMLLEHENEMEYLILMGLGVSRMAVALNHQRENELIGLGLDTPSILDKET